MMNDILSEGFGFDETDLAANQQGHLSPRQRRGFRVNGIILLILTMLMIGATSLLIIALAGLSPSYMSPTAYGLLLDGLMVLICLGVCFKLAFNTFNYLREAAINQCALVTGKASLSMSYTQKVMSYYLTIPGMTFKMRENSYNTLNSQQMYSVYYSVRLKKLMSIENHE